MKDEFPASIKDCITLKGGVRMPVLGFGTYRADEDACYIAVRAALKLGYRHIDTAAVYGNERSVGAAVRDSGLKRDEIFVTTKLWNDDQGYDNTMRAFEKSFRALDIGYVDLYLIHWPVPAGRAADHVALNRETWKAFLDLYARHALRAVGVSNFLPHHLDALTADSTALPPMVNQIEMHPGLNQDETLAYCRAHGIQVEAWRPLLQGHAQEMPLLQGLGEKYGKTAAQICLRWLLQKGVAPLPKSVHIGRIQENADIFDFALSDADMRAIDDLPQRRLGFHPDRFGVRE